MNHAKTNESLRRLERVRRGRYRRYGSVDEAQALLDSDRDFYSSIYNIMEVRNVLATKYHFERDRIADVENTIRTYADPVGHSSLLVQEADAIQEETYVTAMDAIMLAGAKQVDGVLVTFDSELHRHGAKPPEAVLE